MPVASFTLVVSAAAALSADHGSSSRVAGPTIGPRWC